LVLQINYKIFIKIFKIIKGVNKKIMELIKIINKFQQTNDTFTKNQCYYNFIKVLKKDYGVSIKVFVSKMISDFDEYQGHREDIINECKMEIYKKLGELNLHEKTDKSILSYFFDKKRGRLTGHIIDYLRNWSGAFKGNSEWHFCNKIAFNEDEYYLKYGRSLSPEELYINKESIEQLDLIIEEILSEDEYYIFRSYINGYKTQGQVAKDLGMSQQMVSYYKNKARNKLKNEIRRRAII